MLEDLVGHRPDQVLVLGDSVLKLGESARAVQLLERQPHRAVYGNMEWALLEYGSARWYARWGEHSRPELSSWAADVAQTLAEIGREYFARQPATLRIETPAGPLLACHGTPRSCLEALFPPAERGSRFVHDDAQFASALGGVDSAVVVSGHTHRPMVRRSGTTIVVNPGAVGWSRANVADRFKARYALLTMEARCPPSVEWRALRYDNKAALAALRRKQKRVEAAIRDPELRAASAAWHDLIAGSLAPTSDR